MQEDNLAVAPALRRRYPALAQYLSEMVSLSGNDPAAVRRQAMAAYHRTILTRSKTIAMMEFQARISESHVADAHGFWIARTPVSVRLWREYCRATRRTMPDAPPWGWIDNHPVVNVSRDDAERFCAWVRAVGGVAVGLPNAFEWELAATGGELGQVYPWGERFEPRYLWQGERRTAPVDRRERVYVNRYGLVDLAGNVWQWGDGQEVARGGSWAETDPDRFRCFGDGPGALPPRRADIGLRLVAR